MPTRLKIKLKRGFKIPSRSIIKLALNKTSKRFLVSLVMTLFSAAPKKVKITVLARIDRAPKKSTKKSKKRSSKRTVKRKTTKKR